MGRVDRTVFSTIKRRTKRIWRVNRRAFLRWMETTENFLHVVVLLVVPFLLAFVTWLSNVAPFISFLVYPPLASGTYTLFADPESEYASPVADREEDPPEELPGLVVTELERSGDQRLHAVIDYAQDPLQRHDPTTRLEARPGEGITRIEQREGYTLVVGAAVTKALPPRSGNSTVDLHSVLGRQTEAPPHPRTSRFPRHRDTG